MKFKKEGNETAGIDVCVPAVTNARSAHCGVFVTVFKKKKERKKLCTKI